MIEGERSKLESYYFAFGEHDVHVTAELPDDIAAISAKQRAWLINVRLLKY